MTPCNPTPWSRQSLAELTYGFDEVPADDNVDKDKPEEQGILQLLLSDKKPMSDKICKSDLPVNEKDTFTTTMNEAKRLAAHVCMARSRPSSSWTGAKGTSRKQSKLRMPGKKIEMAARWAGILMLEKIITMYRHSVSG